MRTITSMQRALFSHVNVAIVVVLAWCFSVGPAFSMQASNILFDIPEGWEQVRKGDFVYLRPTNTRDAPVTIVLPLTQETVVDNSLQWFERVVKRSVGAAQIKRAEQTKSIDGSRFHIVNKDVTLERGDPLARYIRFIGMRATDQACTLAIVYSSPESLRRHQLGLRIFLQSLRFVDIPRRIFPASPLSGSDRSSRSGEYDQDERTRLADEARMDHEEAIHQEYCERAQNSRLSEWASTGDPLLIMPPASCY